MRGRLRPWSSLVILAIVAVAALTGAHRASADTFGTRVSDYTFDVGQQFTVTFEVDDNGFDPNFCTAGTTVSATFGGVPGPFNAVGATDTTTDCSPSNPTVAITLVGTAPGTGTINVTIGGTTSFSMRVTIRGQNSAPTISGGNPIAKTTAEDTPVSITIPATDANNDPLTYTIASGPSHGTLSGTGATRTYTPAADYTGSDQYTVTVTDGYGGSVTATVNLTVTPVNDAPVAVDDAYTTAEDTHLTRFAPGVLANDSDVDGNPLTIAVISGPTHGTVGANFNGSFDYTPDANFNGTDSFTYLATDGTASSNIATVTINVTPVNDPPVANPDAYITTEDTTLSISRPGVLGNDTAVDGGGSPALTAVTRASPAHGSLRLNPDGSFTYTPDADYSGPDSFTYQVVDLSSGPGGSTTVSITVTAVDDTPVASPQSATTAEDTAMTITLSATDSDTPIGSLTYSIASAPTYGTLSTITSNQVTYTPDVNYHGDDSFTFTVSDGTTTSAAATVSITVTSVNDAPVFLPSSVPSPITVAPTGNAGATVTYPTPTATDVDGNTVTVTCAPASGGRFPVGTTTVTCTADDGQGAATSTATVQFTVTVQQVSTGTIQWIGGPQPNTTYTQATLPAEPTCTVIGSTFPIVQCRVYGYSTTPGTYTLTARARDSQGNATVSTRTYTVTASTPTATPQPATATSRPATATPTRPVRPTATPIVPTATPVTPTSTPVTPAVQPSSTPTRPPRR